MCSYELELVCTDHGQPGLVSVRQLTVDVIDVNDVSPRFDRPVYVTNLVENNLVGALVVQLNVTDADSGANGRIVYSLVDDSGVFEVDPDTGAVTARVVIDREMTSRYRLLVRAVDGGRPTPLSGSAVVVVNVLDMDDQRPQFLLASYSFHVAENQPRGTEVGRLTAVDADLPSHGQFYFRLREVDGGDDSAAFEVDQRSGAVVTTRPLDREHKAEYLLMTEVIEVEPDDDDRPVHRHHPAKINSTATLVIRVLDVNDNRPVFVRPVPEINSETGSGSEATVAVWVGAGVVATLKAVDADEGDNALVTYEIVDGNQEKLLNVDAESGEMTLDQQLITDDSQVNIANTHTHTHTLNFTSSNLSHSSSRPVYIASLLRINCPGLDVCIHSTCMWTRLWPRQRSHRPSVVTSHAAM